MSDKPSFSIIICTFNGLKTIFNVFSQLLKLDCIDYILEIIVIDNNSNSETKDELLKCKELFPTLNIQILQEPKPGKSFALTKGFDAAKNDILIVCDDDNYLHQDYLKNSLAILREHKNVGVIGSFGILKNNENLPKWFDKFKGAWAIGPQKINSGYIDSNHPSLWGAGLVIRKSVWIDIKKLNFNSFLTGRVDSNVSMTGEDTELCILANYLGYQLYYSENLKFTHDVNSARLNWSHFLKLNKGFSRSQIYFELYDFVKSNKNIDLLKSNLIWKKHLMKYLSMFLKDVKFSFFYKGIYLAFVKNKEGYEYGIILRTYLEKILELIRIRRKYATYLKHLAFLHNV
jgi:glycosyltransferase involved in cell wall biosynthesis